MSKITDKSNPTSKLQASSAESPHFSRATLEVAKSELKEFESKSEESFLIRAKMDRKLSSL